LTEGIKEMAPPLSCERRTLTCKRCLKSWVAKQDHGVWPKFCSRKCFAFKAIYPKQKICEACKKPFLAKKSTTSTRGDGRRIFCSVKCAHVPTKQIQRECRRCSAVFSINRFRDDKYCSAKCMHLDLRGDKSAHWRGGTHITTQSGELHLYRIRPDRVGKYEGEHRLIAASIVGRPLESYEFVIRCSREKEDNDPDNLFICASNSEFGRRRSGSLAWPTHSNLEEWKQRHIKNNLT